jgi:uncharacterized DUF497 family protein
MDFEWDEAKNRANIAKHGIDFTRSKEIFSGPTVDFVDHRRNYGETRRAVIGMVEGREVYVVYTVRGEVYRIISARRAKRDERRAYRETYPG